LSVSAWSWYFSNLMWYLVVEFDRFCYFIVEYRKKVICLMIMSSVNIIMFGSVLLQNLTVICILVAHLLSNWANYFYTTSYWVLLVLLILTVALVVVCHSHANDTVGCNELQIVALSNTGNAGFLWSITDFQRTNAEAASYCWAVRRLFFRSGRCSPTCLSICITINMFIDDSQIVLA